jgi:hypothetical protein
MSSVDIASTIAWPLSQHFKERMLPVESHSLRWLHHAAALRETTLTEAKAITHAGPHPCVQI